MNWYRNEPDFLVKAKANQIIVLITNFDKSLLILLKAYLYNVNNQPLVFI
jgi:hypothetical protein